MQWYGVVHHPTFFFLLRHFTDYFTEVSIEVDEDDTTNLGNYENFDSLKSAFV